MVSFTTTMRPAVVTAALPRSLILRSDSQRKQRAAVVAVNSRNFKTSETERKIDRNTPDTEEVNAKLQEYVDQIKDKWEKTDEKPAVVAAGVSAFVVLWALSGLVDRLDNLPLVGGFLELVGLLVTGWFAYRYLTFAPDREELKKSLDSFYQKVTGKKTW